MEQRKNIYLIFKEAVNNAAKYSNTQKIEINAVLRNNELKLVIKDFGKGFDESVVKKGNGLDNIQHRAKELNGQITITTVTGSGTDITLTVPL